MELLIRKLETLLPIVVRVHGIHNTEIHHVSQLFQDLVLKLEHGENAIEDFSKLWDITRGYQVPVDVCESYREVYHILSKLDKEYLK